MVGKRRAAAAGQAWLFVDGHCPLAAWQSGQRNPTRICGAKRGSVLQSAVTVCWEGGSCFTEESQALNAAHCVGIS